jgi:hypothetical protein
MKKNLLFLLIVLTSVLYFTGCSNTDKRTAKKLSEFYPGDITKVNVIEMTSGSTGHTKSFSDKPTIQEWIKKISSIEFQPDPNQEGRSGFLYSVKLFEDNKKMLEFTPNQIEEHYYITAPSLTSLIRQLYESK